MKQYLQALNNKKNLLYFLLIAFCLLVAARYRSRSYWQYPPVYDTFDEFAAGWVGLSLFKSGVPTSWSFIPNYAKGNPKDAKLDLINTNIWVNNIKPSLSIYPSFPKPLLLTKEMDLDGYRSHFNFVMPYLEQPPLGGLIISLPLFISGQNDFKHTSLKILRLPFIFYGMISTILVILIAKKLYGRAVAIVSGLAYATIPTIVIGSRMALPENILTLLFLLEVYFLIQKKLRVPLFIAAIAPLIKPFGFAAALIGAGYYFFIQNDKKIAFRFALIGTASFLCYILYGLLIDKDTFMSVMTYQSKRFFAGPLVFVNKIMIPKITKIFFDGWIFFGWISFFGLCFQFNKTKKYFPIMIPVVSYIIVTSIFGGEDYGWYRFPFYPFLTIFIGIVMVKILKANSFIASLVFLLIVTAFCLQWGLNIQNWNTGLNLFRFLLASSFIVLSYYAWRAKRALAQTFMIIVFIISFYLNTRIINKMNVIWPILGDSSSLIQDRR